MGDLDEYIRGTIEQGDACSRVLREETSSTLRDTAHLIVLSDGMHGIAAMRNDGLDLLVHGAAGDHAVTDPGAHAASLVHRLVDAAAWMGGTPRFFTNVVDASHADTALARSIGAGLRGAARDYMLPCLNGEFADLGERVTLPGRPGHPTANLSGTLVSELPDGHGFPLNTPFEANGTVYVVVRPQLPYVHANSDGIGTKTDVHARAGTWTNGTFDSAAMLLDDTAKLGAHALAISNVLEYGGDIPIERIMEHAEIVGDRLGFPIMYQAAPAHGRWRGHRAGFPVYNVSGTAVTQLSEDALRNPPRPAQGDALIAIRSPEPNPRSNGITALRRAMEARFGPDWHEDPDAQGLLAYLSAPSTVFYPLFRMLLDEHAATAVFHMSGGAYEGKLGRPLARLGLHADVRDPFPPDARAIELMRMSGTTPRNAYRKWGMGSEAFVTSARPERALDLIPRGYDARIVGDVTRATGAIAGVTVTAFDGKRYRFR